MATRDRQRSKRGTPRSNSPGIRNFGTTVLGLAFVAFGCVLVWLPVSAALGDRKTSYVAMFIVAAVGAFIGLFGLSMAWQSARGQLTSRGFFMRWLMKASAKTTPAYALLALAALAAVALVLGLSLNRKADVDDGLVLLLGWLAFHLQILFHEVGHWWFADGCRYRPFRVAFGAFGFVRRDGRWTPYMNRDWRFLMGGAVFTAPPEHEQTWARDFWVSAAGPIASALLLYMFFEAEALIGNLPVLGKFVDINIGLGALTLVLNLLPIPIGMPLSTDGYRILRLLKDRGRFT